MKKNIFIKIIILSCALFPLLSFAESPVLDAGNAGTHGANLATNANTTAQQVLKTLKDYGLDQVAYVLAQKLGQKMSTLAINKATGGASGDKDPNFVQDFGDVLTQIEQQEKDILSSQLMLSNNPFVKDIAINMIGGKDQDGIFPGFTLGDAVQGEVDWQDVGNDLTLAGANGLNFYGQLGLPQNTPMGAGMIAQAKLASQIKSKEDIKKLKLTSSGFLPQSKCNSKVSDYVNNVSAIIGSQNQEFDDPAKAAAYQEAVAKKNNASMQGMTNDLSGCIEEMISNPLETTAKITTEAGKFGMDMTKNITGWGQIVAGVFVSLFNGFINEGLSSLKADYGQMKQANTGGPEQINTTSTGQPTNNFANTPFNIIDLKNDFEPALEGTRKNIKSLSEARLYLEKTPARLAVLDMCIPGPDEIGLKKRLVDYYSQQTDWLMKKSIMGSGSDQEKTNAYQEEILKIIEQDYAVSESERTRDMLDGTRNIPGVAVMKSMVGTFSTKKKNYAGVLESLNKSYDTEIKLQGIITELRKNLTWLRNQNIPGLNTIPDLIFTKEEWTGLPQNIKDTAYNWALTNTTGATAVTGDDARRDFVIATTWRLWEYPVQFIVGNQWPDDTDGASALAEEFLMNKNKVRAIYSSLKSNIPSDWEIEQNEQSRDSYKLGITRIDELIHDCNKMRELFWGTNDNGAFHGKTKQQMLADLLANRNTYFKSTELKNNLSLPSILTTDRTPEEDGCLPNPPQYQASDSTGKNFGDHGWSGFNYSCYGGFGHIYGVRDDIGDHTFNQWLDNASNIYQAIPSPFNVSDIYWKGRIVNMIPENDTDGDGLPNEIPSMPFSVGWTVQELPTGQPDKKDGGHSRALYCRMSSVLATYAKWSATLDRESKNIYCSSKWADVSISEAIGLFILDQLN